MTLPSDENLYHRPKGLQSSGHEIISQYFASRNSKILSRSVEHPPFTHFFHRFWIFRVIFSFTRYLPIFTYRLVNRRSCLFSFDILICLQEHSIKYVVSVTSLKTIDRFAKNINVEYHEYNFMIFSFCISYTFIFLFLIVYLRKK